jgi:hypothetical protein
MVGERSTVGGTLLVLVAHAFPGCRVDAVDPIAAGGDGGRILGSGTQHGPDAGGPRAESDASIPDPVVDPGTGGSSGEPDAGPSALISRQLCFMTGDTLRTVRFPAFDIVNEFKPEPVRTLSRVVAADTVHGELFMQRADGFDVFSVEANGLGAPLRSIILPAEVAAPGSPPATLPGGVAVDTVNDTLVVLTMDEEEFHLSTYPRRAANLAIPIRRMDFARVPFSFDAEVAIDSERGRIFVATYPRVQTFALMATGAVTPLESVELSARYLAISPSRDELHLVVGEETVTLALDSPLDSPPLRTLNSYPDSGDPYPNSGDLIADDLNGELWLAWSAYDVEAVGAAEPLYTAEVTGLPVAVLGGRNELLTQTRSNMLLAYHRQPASGEAPLRVLAGGNAQSQMDLVGVNQARGEVFIRDAQNGFISTYPLAATGSAAPLRRFWQTSSGRADGGRTAYAEANGLIFASFAGTSYLQAPVRVYADTSDGLVQPGAEVARDMVGMAVDVAHGELLGVSRGPNDNQAVVEAHSTVPSDLGDLQRSFVVPPRPGHPYIAPIDIAYDPGRDEVIVAVQNCVLNPGREGPDEPEDCHFDLKLFPRTAGPDTPVETVAMETADINDGFTISSLAFDERNDLLLIQRRSGAVTFYARGQVAGVTTLDAGLSVVTPLASYGAGADSNVRYCD